MKASIAVLTSVFVLSAPFLAHASADALQSSLADATRGKMSVAPWVGVTVSNVTVTDKISWVALTSGGQVYACAAHADAGALLSRDGVACVRAGSAPKCQTATLRELNARLAQTRRMNVTLATWSGPDSRGVTTPAGSVTMSALGN